MNSFVTPKNYLTFFLLLISSCVFADKMTLVHNEKIAEIDTRNGALLSFTDAGVKWINPSYDIYRLLSVDGAKELSDESGDRVASVVNKNNEVKFVCSNPALGETKIEKRYFYGPNGQLHKAVTFYFADERKGFLDWSLNIRLRPSVRKGGYYSDPRRHPMENPNIKSSKIKGSTTISMMYGADYHLALFYQPADERTFGTLRYLNNSEFLTPLDAGEERRSLIYNSTGWEMGAGVFPWKPNPNGESAEVIYLSCPGNFHDAYECYQKLPAFVEVQNYSSPVWVRNVTILHRIYFAADRVENYDKIRQIAAITRNGNIVVILWDVWDLAGNWTIDKPWKSIHGYPLNKKKLKDIVDKIKSIDPRIKVGVYNWWWAVNLESDMAKKHPEWIICDASGKPRYSTIGPDYLPNAPLLMTQECKNHILKFTDKLLGEIGVDYIYIDTGQGGTNSVDWKTGRQASFIDWKNLYKDMQGVIRKHGKDRAFFMNATNGLYSMYNDMSFFEGFLPVKDWRGLSDRLALIKLHQQPGRWIAPIYWSPGEGENKYIEHVLLFGLAGMHPDYDLPMLLSRRGYITAIGELQNYPMQANWVKSLWWYDDNVNYEAYAFKTDFGSLAVTYLDHGKSSNVVLQVNPKDEYAKKTRYYLWLQAPLIYDKLLDYFHGLTETQEQEDYINTQTSASALVANSFCEEIETSDTGAFKLKVPNKPDAMYRFLMTTIPVVQSSENGMPLQFWKAVQGTQNADGSITIELDTNSDVVLPVFAEDKAIRLWKLANASTNESVIIPGSEGKLMQMFSLKAGKWTFLKQVQSLTEQISTDAVRITDTKKVYKPGDTVKLETKENFEKDTIVYGTLTLRGAVIQRWKLTPDNKYFNIKLNKNVESFGHYDLTFIVQKGNMLLRVKPLTLAVDSGQKRHVFGLENKVTQINTRWKNLEILKTFAQTVGHSPSDYAEVMISPNAIVSKAGVGDETNHGYGFAGIEMKVGKNEGLKIRAKVTPPLHGMGYAYEYNGILAITVDYHTSNGYLRRLYVPFGGMEKGTPSASGRPYWGTCGGASTKSIDSKMLDMRSMKNGGEITFDLNLPQYAPQGWDGQIVFGTVSHLAGRGAALETSILGTVKSDRTCKEPDAVWTLPENFAIKKSGLQYKGLTIAGIIYPEEINQKIVENNLTDMKNGFVKTKSMKSSSANLNIVGLELNDAFLPKLRLHADETKSTDNVFLVVDYPIQTKDKKIAVKRIIYSTKLPDKKEVKIISQNLGVPSDIECRVLPKEIFGTQGLILHIAKDTPPGSNAECRIWLVSPVNILDSIEIFDHDTFYVF